VAGKWLMAGLNTRTLKHFKLIVSGKEKVDLKRQ